MISTLVPKEWDRWKSFTVASIRRQFPSGHILTQSDLEVIAVMKELRPILDKLSDLAMKEWRKGDQSETETSAVASITIAGASLQGEILTLGGFVVRKIKPYWFHRLLLSKEERMALLSSSSSLGELIDSSLQLDDRIRRRLKITEL